MSLLRHGSRGTTVSQWAPSILLARSGASPTSGRSGSKGWTEGRCTTDGDGQRGRWGRRASLIDGDTERRSAVGWGREWRAARVVESYGGRTERFYRDIDSLILTFVFYVVGHKFTLFLKVCNSRKILKCGSIQCVSLRTERFDIWNICLRQIVWATITIKKNIQSVFGPQIPRIMSPLRRQSRPRDYQKFTISKINTVD